jgi:hypothetical protein
MTASVIATATRTSTAAATAAPERKLISSRRAYSQVLSLPGLPVPSLTPQHDTGMSEGLLGR